MPQSHRLLRAGGRTTGAFTFIEILLSLSLIGTAIVAFAQLVTQDMRNVKQLSWGLVAATVARTEADRLSRYGGTDGYDSNSDGDFVDLDDVPPVNSTFPACVYPPTSNMVFATHAAPGNYPELAQLPWARGLRCQQPFQSYCTGGLGGGCPGARQLTVIVQAYFGPLDGAGNPPAGDSSTFREWKHVTVVAPSGVDKTP